jgi:hypothetical protein
VGRGAANPFYTTSATRRKEGLIWLGPVFKRRASIKQAACLRNQCIHSTRQVEPNSKAGVTPSEVACMAILLLHQKRHTCVDVRGEGAVDAPPGPPTLPLANRFSVCR